MIDITKAKIEFKKFIENYDNTNNRIKVKIAHTYRVSENSLKIAQELNLSEEQQNLARLIGLLHDIGRFEQIKIYNTYIDSKSIDHAKQGLITLFDEGHIRDFIKEDTYDKIIYKAIKNHNKYKIEEGMNEIELLHSKIIRDADKLDIYHIVTTEDLKNAVNFESSNIAEEQLSQNVYEKFLKEELVSYENMKSNIDQMVVWIGYIYDINYKESLKIIRQNRYIDKIVERVKYQDIETKKRMREIQEFANRYIGEKIK